MAPEGSVTSSVTTSRNEPRQRCFVRVPPSAAYSPPAQGSRGEKERASSRAMSPRSFERPATISLPGTSMVLEGLHVPVSEAGRGAVIAPPHPLYGGSMDSPVVTEIAHVSAANPAEVEAIAHGNLLRVFEAWE